MTPDAPGPWPALPLAPWRGTKDALHMWSQIVGKTLLELNPPQNHWWHAALRVSSRGLASPAPTCHAERAVDLELDLVDHALHVRSDGRERSMPLRARSVHSFLDEYLSLLRAVGVEPHLRTLPVEVKDPVPFDHDDVRRPYDREAAHRFWQVLLRCDAALRELADEFVGKQSPVHFFWGAFDLAATRFSGRRAPEREGADLIQREAYSHEVISFGFWPGGVTQAGIAVEEPVVYAYAAPEPSGFRDADMPEPAYWHASLGEFLLPYEAIRTSPDPAAVIRAFCEAAYQAGARLGGWDRETLERAASQPGARPSAHEEGPPATH
jgi:hypothetical protein